MSREAFEAELIALIHKHHATGRVALSWVNNDGIEVPTDIAKCFARSIRAAALEEAEQAMLHRGWTDSAAAIRQLAKETE